MKAGKRNVLLVEDDPNQVFLMRRALAKANLPAEALQVAADGDEAIAYLRGDGEFADRSQFPLPCFLLLDLHMPKRSGLEVIEWMRDQEMLKLIPIVVLTSSTSAEDVEHAYARGANSYLNKPTEFSGLQQLVGSVVNYWNTINVAYEMPSRKASAR